MSSSCFGLDRSLCINYLHTQKKNSSHAKIHTNTHRPPEKTRNIQIKYTGQCFDTENASMSELFYFTTTHNVCFLFSSYLSSRCHLVWTDRNFRGRRHCYAVHNAHINTNTATHTKENFGRFFRTKFCNPDYFPFF